MISDEASTTNELLVKEREIVYPECGIRIWFATVISLRLFRIINARIAVRRLVPRQIRFFKIRTCLVLLGRNIESTWLLVCPSARRRRSMISIRTSYFTTDGKKGYSEAILRYYKDIMGVSITYLDKYCPEQYMIIENEYSL